MKKLILFLFVAFAFTVNAQHGVFTDMSFKNGTAVLTGAVNGRFYYDQGTNKFTFRQGGAWVELPGSAISSVTGTSNRITSTGGLTPVIDISASYVGQASITTLGTISVGTWNAGLIPALYGGTGASLSPTNGGILIGNSGAFVQLTAGSASQVLTMSGGFPSWQTPSAGFANPMSTLGDVLYEDATPVAVRLAGNTTTTKKFFTQTGNGSISAVPGWNVLVVGDLPVLSGLSTGSTPTGADYLIMNQGGSNVKLALSSLAGYSTVQNSAAPQTQRATINVTNGLYAADDPTNTVTLFKLGGTLTEFTSFSGGYPIEFSNTGNASFRVTGNWTATASLNRSVDIGPTLTGTSTVSDILYVMAYDNASLIAGANSQTLTLVQGNATYNVNSKTGVIGQGWIFNPTESGSLSSKTALGIKSGWFVGVGTFAPTTDIYVTRSSAAAFVTVTAENSSSSGYGGFTAQTGSTTAISLFSSGSAATVSNLNNALQGNIYNTSGNSGGIYVRNLSSGPFIIGMGGDVVGTNDAFRLNTKGSAAFIQQVLTASWLPAVTFTPGAHTGQAGATEYINYQFNGATQTAASGTTATQRNYYIKRVTYAGTSGTRTVTNPYGLYVEDAAAGSNGAVTNNYAIGADGNLALVTAGNKLFIKEGSNGSMGQATLVAGTKAITITGVTTSTRAFIGFVSAGGTVTTTWQYKTVCTANTLTITAIDNTGTTNTSDTSVINYFVIEPTP